jgi:hypothetical protein
VPVIKFDIGIAAGRMVIFCIAKEVSFIPAIAGEKIGTGCFG